MEILTLMPFEILYICNLKNLKAKFININEGNGCDKKDEDVTKEVMPAKTPLFINL